MPILSAHTAEPGGILRAPQRRKHKRTSKAWGKSVKSEQQQKQQLPWDKHPRKAPVPRAPVDLSDESLADLKLELNRKTEKYPT